MQTTDGIPQLFRYFGSKSRMAPAIATIVPRDTNVLISLFMGSGAFEYNYAKDHPECRVVCFDIDPAVVNYHHQALKKRVNLHDAILSLHADLLAIDDTGMSKEKYVKLLVEHRGRTARHKGLKAAARFYLLTAYSFNGKFGSYAAKPSFSSPPGLLRELPKNIEVHLGDALQILASGIEHSILPSNNNDPRLCLYLDPPYMYPMTKNYYTANTFDHEGLSSLLHASDHKWILSYNDTLSVRQLYRKKSTMSLPISYTYYKANNSASLSNKAELIVCNRISQRRKKVRQVFDKCQRQFGGYLVQAPPSSGLPGR